MTISSFGPSPLPKSAAIILALLSTWGLARAADTPTQVRYYITTQANAPEQNYKQEVVTLLLEKSKAKYGPYAMEAASAKGMTQGRVFRELQGGRIDLTTSMTDASREDMAIPIRYCLYKGLLGVRIGMGTKATVDALNSIQTRDELNQVELGQVFDWPDYSVQHEAGLKVARLSDFSAGLVRLENGSLSLMPLGVVEVAPIAKAHSLSLISTWAIAYPTAYYIFVSKKRPELAERLKYGFEMALKDHSFGALFAKRIGTQLAAAGLEKRRMFYVPNHYLPKETPLDRKELWHPLVLQKLQ